jgi:hypothetical protein
MNNASSKEQPAQQQVKVRHGESPTGFASQFLVQSTDEDITIHFSSGFISDPVARESVLPIHTRIAMTLPAAARLHALLGQVLAGKAAARGAARAKVPEAAKAQFPKVND